MPQHVFIQADIPAAPSLAKKSAATADKSSSEAFAAELNKYSQSDTASQSAANERRASSSQQETEAAAKQSEKNTVDDGNKLPPEEAAATNDDIEKTANETSDATEDEQQEAQQDGSSNQQASNAEQTENGVPVVSQSLESDKSTRTQAGVSQKVDVNSKTTSAEVPVSNNLESARNSSDKASASTQATLKVSEQTQASDKIISSNVKQPSTAQSQDKSIAALPASLDKLLTEEIKSTPKGQPNLAAVLETKDKADAKPTVLRADIFDALQRKNSDKDVAMNLRNVIAAQMQEQSDKPDMTKALLAAERAGQEAKAASPGTAFSTLTAASASTSGTIQTAISAQGVSLPVQPTLQNPAWSQVMSSRVVWMAKEGVHQAELRMTPANLGPVEVRLQVQNDQASVTFLAQHSATRDALEQALPRLRESFAEAGIELGHSEVGEQQQQDSETEHADDAHIFTQASGAGDDIENEQEEQQPLGETSAGLSLYA
ncbi:flagellar hook-length control protein FliK [Methylophaga thiooxydans]|uniref:flagellar hook-length control protein FliK n=1 Tax=Methylophaga thiooxydans TaxID=392484 RepID=UPI0023532F7D|nr:flagellar hook-length control protein FliK [Methylophaga thiooxydans]